MGQAVQLTDDQLAERSAAFETRPAQEVIRWAADTFGAGLCLTTSLTDALLVDLALSVEPTIEVVFLDTQYHFAETLWYVDQIRRRYDLNLTVMEPEIAPDNRWQQDPDGCCALRKVEPLGRALEGKAAWMTGLRRVEATTRANAPIVSYDIGRGLVTVNPLATWSDDDVDGYVRDRGLPTHPLADRGYRSIGCWPCSRPVGNGEDARAGRWAGTDKIECGLHT